MTRPSLTTRTSTRLFASTTATRVCPWICCTASSGTTTVGTSLCRCRRTLANMPGRSTLPGLGKSAWMSSVPVAGLTSRLTMTCLALYGCTRLLMSTSSSQRVLAYCGSLARLMATAFCRYSCSLMLTELRIGSSVDTVVSTKFESTRLPTRTRAMPATPSMGERTRVHSRLSSAWRRLPRAASTLATDALTASTASMNCSFGMACSAASGL